MAELAHQLTMEETKHSAGNDAVRRFRARQKVKEQEDKEKRERLKKENQEIEERMACYQQVQLLLKFNKNLKYKILWSQYDKPPLSCHPRSWLSCQM